MKVFISCVGVSGFNIWSMLNVCHNRCAEFEIFVFGCVCVCGHMVSKRIQAAEMCIISKILTTYDDLLCVGDLENVNGIYFLKSSIDALCDTKKSYFETAVWI